MSAVAVSLQFMAHKYVEMIVLSYSDIAAKW